MTGNIEKYIAEQPTYLPFSVSSFSPDEKSTSISASVIFLRFGNESDCPFVRTLINGAGTAIYSLRIVPS